MNNGKPYQFLRDEVRTGWPWLEEKLRMKIHSNYNQPSWQLIDLLLVPEK